MRNNDSLWTPSTLPSRFLDETQIEPTVQVMSALQRYANGQDDGRADFITSVERSAGNRHIMQNLLAQYLGQVSDDGLLSALATIIARAKEQPFAYRYAYKRGHSDQSNDHTSAGLHDAWARIR